MQKFEKKQKTYEISGVKIGGQPGEIPTVLIGSIFYQGHKIVIDENRGIFDKEKAEELINRQDEFSDKTGNPCMLDVVGVTSEALEKYLDFVTGVTESPILMDGGVASNNIKGLDYAKEVGMLDRIVYNSLTPHYKEPEIKKIKEVGLESVILLTLNTRDFTVKGRITTAREFIKLVNSLGIPKPLIDTCVLDIPTLGQACQTIVKLKEEFGFPVGCGAHNAVSTWRGLLRKMGKQAVKPCLASSCVIPVAVGGDFVLYGPIEEAEVVFPAVAMTDAALGRLSAERGNRPDHSHPMYKIA